MEELRFQVVVNRNLDPKVSGVLAFGQFESDDPETAIYGESDLVLFFRDLILGRPFPLTLVVRGVDNLGVLTAIALFLHRDLAICPNIPGFISAVTLVDTLGVPGLAHLDRDLAGLLRFVPTYLRGVPEKEVQQGLAVAIGWIREYLLQGTYPSLPPIPSEPRIIDRGSNGFVFASVSHTDLMLGWEELYRMGFLRGLLVHKVSEDRWHVLGARKSVYLSLDLHKVASALNQVEEVMSEPSEWKSDGYWLWGPPKGTLILPSALLNVFLRS